MRVIWLEWFLLENALGNLAILWGTSRWLGMRTGLARMTLIAAAGAAYGFFEHWLAGALSLLAVKLAVSAVMVLTAFGLCKARLFVLRVLCFYAVTFLFGGGAIAIGYLTGLQSPGIAFAAIIICSLMLERLIRYHSLSSRRTYARIKIEAELGFESYVNALIDTGNSLKEPISAKPVLLVQKDSIKLSAELNAALKSPHNEPDASLAYHIRLIPYRVLGNNRDVLSAFEPVGVYVMDTQWSKRECYIALVEDKLSENDDFEAIAPPSFSIETGSMSLKRGKRAI